MLCQRQIFLFGVLLERISQTRAVLEVFSRGCCFCTYPAWDAPVELATSCMADKCQLLEERANLIGDLTMYCKTPVVLALWPVLSCQAAAAAEGSRARQLRCREMPFPLALRAFLSFINCVWPSIVCLRFRVCRVKYCVKRELLGWCYSCLVDVVLAWLVLFLLVFFHFRKKFVSYILNLLYVFIYIDVYILIIKWF